MSGIAEVLINQNYEVSGSDQIKSSVTDHLESLGADIHFNHKPENVFGKHVVVVSSAIRNDNSQVKAAKIAKKAFKENISLREAADKLDIISKKKFDQIVQPKKMI